MDDSLQVAYCCTPDDTRGRAGRDIKIFGGFPTEVGDQQLFRQSVEPEERMEGSVLG